MLLQMMIDNVNYFNYMKMRGRKKLWNMGRRPGLRRQRRAPDQHRRQIVLRRLEQSAAGVAEVTLQREGSGHAEPPGHLRRGFSDRAGGVGAQEFSILRLWVGHPPGR